MLFLLPPSEGKKPDQPIKTPQSNKNPDKKTHTQLLDKPLPLSLACNATKKDLKCSGARYDEGIELNKTLSDSALMPAIERYTGTMFKAIAYDSLSLEGKTFFDAHVRIISWLYGIVAPQTPIGNYKLPIWTRWLTDYRWDAISEYLAQSETELLIDLLPQAHKKLIDWESVDAQRVLVDFYHWDKKLAHWVKWVKGMRLHTVAEQWVEDLSKRPRSFVYKDKTIRVVIDKKE